MDKAEKIKKLKAAFKKYNKEVEKKGLKADIGFAKDMPEFGKVELVSTGIYKLDKLIGGIPRGRYTEIYGPESAGKSTLVEAIMGSFQRQDGIVALANNEFNYETLWAAKQGLNVDELVGGNFPDLEECLNFTIDMAETEGACDLLTVDTITALSSKQEQRKKAKKGTPKSDGKARDLDDDTMALIARKLSQFFRMATVKVHDAKMALILVNQVRASIDGYGDGLGAAGGNALKHYKSLDLFITRAKPKKEAFKDSHFMMNVHVKKSKFKEALEGTKASLFFKIGTGIDNTLDIITDAIDVGIIDKSNNGYYKYNDLNIQGYDKFSTALESEKHLEQIKDKLLNDTIEPSDSKDKEKEDSKNRGKEAV